MYIYIYIYIYILYIYIYIYTYIDTYTYIAIEWKIFSNVFVESSRFGKIRIGHYRLFCWLLNSLASELSVLTKANQKYTCH